MSRALGILFPLFTALIVILGDTLIKVAADDARLASLPMAGGMALYAGSAICWFFAMRHISMGQAAVAYAMLSLIALVVIGALLFGEKIGAREGLGVLLALAAMGVMSSQHA